MSGEFWGKYRGEVTDIQDPLLLGRVRARVPDVLGPGESGWALPCAPFGGGGSGLFALPKAGAAVWIEFEHGDPDRPIWSGCFWEAPTEVPPLLLVPPYKKVMLRTAEGHSITLDDTPVIGGITLETAGGQKIVLDSTGIAISNGQGASIRMVGPRISLNDGALEVQF
jgi:uncharacterized protein involved in type VI secretion and phage assembly